MGSKIRSAVVALLMTVVATAVMVLPANAAQALTSCNYYKRNTGGYDGVYYTSALNIRTGPYTSCTIVAVAGYGEPVHLWCSRNGSRVSRDNAYFDRWVYGYFPNRGRYGWVSTAYLYGAGNSTIGC